MSKLLAIIATLFCLAIPIAALMLLPGSDESGTQPTATPVTPAATGNATPAGETPKPADGTAAATDASATPAVPSPPVRVFMHRELEGMKIDTIKEGAGRAVKDGDAIQMHYTGWSDGFGGSKKFDSSRDPGKKPFAFTVGKGQAIKGWDKGAVGMKPGEVRRLEIPAELGYGANAAAGGKIPPNSTLYFEVEYVGPQ